MEGDWQGPAGKAGGLCDQRVVALSTSVRACSPGGKQSYSWRDALRAKRRERRVIDRTWPYDHDSFSAGDAQGPLDSRAQLMRVRVLMAEMRHDRVEVLLLHDLMGHELPEIALMLGISVPAAQSRLFRGRRELRERLENSGLVTERGRK